MMLTKRDIRSGFRAIGKKARDAFEKGDCSAALRCTHVCSEIAGQFNLQYADDGLESLLKRIAGQALKLAEQYEPVPTRWILYDDFCTSYVLGLQWLEAMALSGRELLYVTTRDIHAESRHRNILDRVAGYPNVRVEVIPQGDILARAQTLYDVVVRFQASKIVLHKRPTGSVMDLVLPVLPAGLTSYLLHLSDQTYWLGARSVDYCLEFRPFGASVSLQRRGLRREQLLMVPFYPADDGNAFQGFPPECTRDKIVVFSGGDFYKTLDERRVYWHLIQTLLNRYPQVVFLFATKNIPEGDSDIRRFIQENHLEGRFIYISFRPDIYQVFAHCDIYMGTSPASGSLMTQLAAINGKPILQYYEPGTPDDETEQAVCMNETFVISFRNEEDFLKEADRLIASGEYRREQGDRLRRAMMQRDQFNSLVLKTLETNESQRPLEDYPVDFRILDDRWYYLEKAGYLDTMPYIYGTLGARDCFRYAPGLFLKRNVGKMFDKRRSAR